MFDRELSTSRATLRQRADYGHLWTENRRICADNRRLREQLKAFQRGENPAEIELRKDNYRLQKENERLTKENERLARGIQDNPEKPRKLPAGIRGQRRAAAIAARELRTG